MSRPVMQRLFRNSSRLQLFLALAAIATLISSCDSVTPPTLGW